MLEISGYAQDSKLCTIGLLWGELIGNFQRANDAGSFLKSYHDHVLPEL